MKNNNDEALKNYFDSMLHDNTMAKASIAPSTDVKEKLPDVSGLPQELVFSESSTEKDQKLETHEQLNTEPSANDVEEWSNIDVGDEFQVLFFELNNVTFAVPLTDLGGIFHLDDTLNFLMGKPKWFSGVMKAHDGLYNIVNTALWLKLDHNPENLQYTHYVVLGNTSWGLSCEHLLGTESLKKEQVRWREKKGSRPWLAGMVKKKMCALIHADELVKLLNQGIDIHG